MAKPITIPIQLTLDDKGAKAAIAAIQGVDKATIAGQRSAAASAAAVAKLAQAQAQGATAAARLTTAQNAAAASGEKLAQAQARTARELAQTEKAQTQAAAAALRFQQAQERAAKPPSSGLVGYFRGLGEEVAKTATSMVAAGAVIEGVKSTFESFKEAFNFKAELDATTASINVQLRGVRDSGAVWAEAQQYAQKYKLTQAETASTIQASVGILRTSQSSVEDTFGVLQRLTVLAPGKTIEDAAFSVRELASGDIMSIADQFNISRKNAYAMRDAIAAGQDPVKVIAQFLDQAGVSMDSLKVRTEGVLGAQKDLAIQEEQLKLAQAEWAQGPGLAILQGQINVTRGATRLLSGDFKDMAASLQQAGQDNPILQWLPGFGQANAQLQLLASRQAEAATSTADAATVNASYEAGIVSLGQAFTSGVITYEQYTAARASLMAQQQALISGTTAEAAATQQASDATDRHTEAQQRAAQAAQQRQSAITTVVAGLVDQAAKEVMGEEKANALYAIQSDLASIGGAVAAGHMTAGEGAIVLAAKYGIAIDQARLLLDLESRVAGGNARLAGQQANTRELAPQGVGYNAPGRQGTGDVEAAIRGQKAAAEAATAAEQARADQIRRTGTAAQKSAQLQKDYDDAVRQFGAGSAEAIRAETDLIAARQAGGKGAKARANAEESLSAKILSIARKTGDELIAIDKRVAEEREKNLRKLAADIETTTGSMVAQQEADDLDLVGASAEEADRLRAREQAQANARIAEAQAVSEAKKTAAEGDAQTATEVYDLRQQQIQQQQALDEKYYQRQQELAGDNKAQEELTTQYNEATAAINDDTNTRIALAQQEADERAAAVAAEKQAVLDKAAAEAAALDATGKAGSTAASRVAELQRALTSLPENVTTTITVNEVRTSSGGSESSSGSGGKGGGGGGTAKAAGGGTFVTHGRSTITVGDNPGGVEMVSVTPLSGRGTSSASGNIVRMAGGGSAIVDAAADDATRRLGSGTTPSLPAASAGKGSLKGAAKDAADDQKDAKAAIADYAKAARDNLDLLNETLKLRQVLNDPATWAPIPEDVIRVAAADADKVARAFADIAATYDTKVLESAKTYSDALKGAFDVIKDGLETFDRLRGSDIVVPESQLRAFEGSAANAIDMVGRLGERAAGISQEQVTALGNLASTLAVLPSLGLLGVGGGGGGGDTTNMGGVQIAIYQQPGQDANALAALVMQKLGGAVSGRR